MPTLAAQERVDELMRALAPRLAGTRLEVSGGPNRPPLEEASSAALFAVAQRIAADLGLAPSPVSAWAEPPTATTPPASAARRSTGSARWAAAPTPTASTWS